MACSHGGRRDGWLVPIGGRHDGPIAGLVIGNIRLQAGLQGRSATTLQRRSQVAAHIGIAQLAACMCLILRGQGLSVGQQLINLTIAIHTAGGNRSSIACRAPERALVERADGLHSITLAVGAQVITGRQFLSVGEARTGALVLVGLATVGEVSQRLLA